MKHRNFILLILFPVLISVPFHHAFAQDISDLPLVVQTPAEWKTDYLVILISGDGGWAHIDKRIANYLNQRGTSLVCLDSRKYFGKKKTPEESAMALERTMHYYSRTWKKDKFVIIGYSRGASVVPFMVNRINKDWRDKIALIALLGPDRYEDFEIHLLGYIGLGPSNSGYPVLPEVQKLTDKKVLYFYGDKEDDSLCRILDPTKYTLIQLKGGHHFDGDYESITQRIIDEVK